MFNVNDATLAPIVVSEVGTYNTFEPSGKISKVGVDIPDEAAPVFSLTSLAFQPPIDVHTWALS